MAAQDAADSPNLLEYARLHGIATDHRRVITTYFQLEQSWQPQAETRPVRLSWYEQRLDDLEKVTLLEDYRIPRRFRSDIESIMTESQTRDVDRESELQTSDYILLETLVAVKVEKARIDGPLFLRNEGETKMYLDRVSPFAYMGVMNLSAPYEVVTDDIVAADFQLDALSERLEIKREFIEYLTEMTTPLDELQAAKVTLDSRRPRHCEKLSSPLLPYAALHNVPVDIPRLALDEEDVTADYSFSPMSLAEEEMSPATSVIHNFALSPSPSPKQVTFPGMKRRVPYFSSPLLGDERKRLRLNVVQEIGDNETSVAGLLVDKSSVELDIYDKRLESQLQLNADLTRGILEQERLTESNDKLRIAIPYVDVLPTIQQRRTQVMKSFPMNAAQIRTTLASWNRSSDSGYGDWHIQWKPFTSGKEKMLEDLKAADSFDSDSVKNAIAEWSAEVIVDLMFSRNHLCDWDLSDDEEDDDRNNEQLLTVALGASESLDELIAMRKTRDSTETKALITTTALNLPLNPFVLYNVSTASPSRAPANVRQEVDNNADIRRSENIASLTKSREAAVTSLGVHTFSPAIVVIFNTSFLSMHSSIYRDILTCSNGLAAIERDYGADEADILVSATFNILVFSFVRILQRSPDGTRIALTHALRIARRVEQLAILVLLPDALRSQSDWDGLADFMCNTAGAARVFLVANKSDNAIGSAGCEVEAVRWIIDVLQKFGGAGDGIAEVETTWERFLRRTGVNGYAAQMILKQESLKSFIDAGHEGRRVKHVARVGEKVLTAATKVFDTPFTILL
ncbi:uncharacterized protein V1518DRAFT_415944 [Limtongia smithiae]|uniref:uncharacterized protein n=1 Tax=Limtongia smithiae TaxID=1125753 RepID=UPI0034CEB95D